MLPLSDDHRQIISDAIQNAAGSADAQHLIMVDGYIAHADDHFSPITLFTAALITQVLASPSSFDAFIDGQYVQVVLHSSSPGWTHMVIHSNQLDTNTLAVVLDIEQTWIDFWLTRAKAGVSMLSYMTFPGLVEFTLYSHGYIWKPRLDSDGSVEKNHCKWLSDLLGATDVKLVKVGKFYYSCHRMNGVILLAVWSAGLSVAIIDAMADQLINRVLE